MNWTFRIASLSLQIPRQALLAGALLLAMLLALAAFAAQLGSYPLGLTRSLQVLAGQGSAMEQLVLLDLRLPRILSALGAGAAFGLSGAIFQAMLRNPLASPDVIGFNAGASCGALAALILTGGLVLPGAIAGALLTAAAVTLLAWKGGLSPARLILTGIGAGLALSATADLLLSRLDIQSAVSMAHWLTGSLNARNWDDAVQVWAGLALLAPLALWLQFPLARLPLGEETAAGLGLNLPALRLALTVTGTLLAALAVSTAGPLPFVAFAAGPLARALRPGGHPALPGAALAGALITLLADTASRALPGIQLPAGVFTALAGAPLLIWMLLRHFRKGPF
ncbi:iron chelate uptake ABC transporter family permease subunit [Leisingera sp. MMG026]|uniref:FecCD family ABC transporter permease n=1 Tax=Leisingera sp. MMG026 TaxID=2909982 RepID=UPI0031CC78C1|nr:iron chelate uptake ABC transporter family permease subunit [Leisingera sp. MMG026]